jgi:hypothetical protein
LALDDVDSIVLVLLWFTCWVKEVEVMTINDLEERQYITPDSNAFYLLVLD